MTRYPIAEEGVDLLKESESFVGVAYPDPCSALAKALQAAGLWRKTLKGAPIPKKFEGLSGAPWTIGYGFTDNVTEGDTMTQAEGDERLARELGRYTGAVVAMCKVVPNDNQLAALVVCGWNIGLNALAKSSIVKAHNRMDFGAAARAFGLWNKAGGQVVEALEVRRAAEATLYRKPVPALAPIDEAADEVAGDQATPTPPPQLVQGESSLLRSPIVQGTGATAVTALAGLKEASEQASTASGAISTLAGVLGPLQPYWPYLAMAAVVIVAGGVIWHRYMQRRKGWA